ncbi:peptide deformylase [bacterium]|nr:peptide deformylase [bacterium]NBX97833.1 peptide deformylase [bacterium]
MNRNNIITLPNSHLRQRSKKVAVITPEILQLIADMKAATLDWEDHRDHEVGVALAAVQVDKLWRIVVVRDDFDDKTNRDFAVFINPTIAKYYGKIEQDFEGCLSIKDVYGKVPRYTKVKVDAMNEEGRNFRITAEGFLARIFQHEIDHTNGVVYIDHIKDNSEAFYKLAKDGKLTPLDYEAHVKDNKDLWHEQQDED